MTTAKRTEDEHGNRHYTYPPTGEELVSVTTVLGATDGKQHYLVPWSARLAAEYAVDNLAALAQVAKAEGHQAAVDLAKEQSERIRNIKRDAGSYVHDVVESLILWSASPEGTGAELVLPLLPEKLIGADYDDEPLEDVVDWMIGGFCNFVSDFMPEFEAAEMTVFHVELGVAGTLDMILILRNVAIGAGGRLIAAPGGMLVLCVDVKTGKYLDCTVREQIASYRRMLEALLPMGQIVPMPKTDAGAVLHLRPEYDRGYRLMLVAGADDERAWDTFTSALAAYHGRKGVKAKPGKVVYPLRPDGTMPAPLLADLDGEGYGRVLSPLTKAGIADLEQLAALDKGDCLAIRGIAGKSLTIIRRMLADHGLSLRGDELTAEREVA
jgi:hypothetical protein